jgi:hypothetical protein
VTYPLKFPPPVVCAGARFHAIRQGGNPSKYAVSWLRDTCRRRTICPFRSTPCT